MTDQYQYPIGQDVPLNYYMYDKQIIWNSVKFSRDFHTAVNDKNYKLLFKILSYGFDKIVHKAKYGNPIYKNRYTFEVAVAFSMIKDSLFELLDNDDDVVVARIIQELWAIQGSGVSFPDKLFYPKIMDIFLKQDFYTMTGIDDIKYWGASFLQQDIDIAARRSLLHQRNILRRWAEEPEWRKVPRPTFSSVKEDFNMTIEEKMHMLWGALDHNSMRILNLMSTYHNQLYMITPLCSIISKLCLHKTDIYDNFIENELYQLLDIIISKDKANKKSLRNITTHIRRYLINDIAQLK